MQLSHDNTIKRQYKLSTTKSKKLHGLYDIATLNTCISINQKHQNYTNKNGDHDANICNTIFIGHDKKLYISSFRLSF